jgi:dTDP-4-dehydrorhamnose 3,5-epimerase
MPFTFESLKIPDVVLIERKSFSDQRGYFMELFQSSAFTNFNIKTKFVQDNFSYSKKNVLRGLHYQKNPTAQAKLVIPLKGEIFDVAVDIRKNSSTYGKWIGQILSETNHKMLFIPEGFAHGFCVISDEANVLYKVNQEYSVENERGLIWNDSDIGIEWPINNPVLSEQDIALPKLSNLDNNF